MFSTILSGLGGLAEVAQPFITTEEEQMEHDRYMREIEAEMSKYEAEKDIAMTEVEKAKQMTNTIKTLSIIAGIGITAFLLFKYVF